MLNEDRKKLVVVGGLEKKLVNSLAPKLEERGIDIIHHYSGRMNGYRRGVIFPPSDGVLFLTDTMDHGAQEIIRSCNPEANIIYGSRKWSHTANALKLAGVTSR